jgi:hypothetical protein
VVTQVAVRIKLRRDTAANWTAENPILADGEQGHETDTNRRKIGNGTDAWADLPYLFETGASDWGDIGGTLSNQTDLQTALDDKAATDDLADVAFSGDYDDLINTPMTPSGTWGDITGTLSDQTDLQNALNSKQDSLSAFNNALFYQEAPGVISGIPNWAVNSQGGFDRTLQVSTDNGGFKTANNNLLNVTNVEDSPNEQYSVNFNRATLDVTDTGFDLGSNGRAVTIINNDVQATTEADIGEITFAANNFNVGDGVNAKNVRGFSYSYGFGNVAENVTINGPIQGYGFQPFFADGSFVDTVSSYVSAFYDNLNAPDTTFGFYTSYQATPNLGGIANDSNFTGINLSPSVAEFNGNAGFTGIGLFGSLGDFGTGTFSGISVGTSINSGTNVTGININQNVTSCDNYTGLDINISNVSSSGVYRAAFFGGDVDINGSLSFTGALSIGNINAFAQKAAEDFGFEPETVHALISNLVGLENETHTNADMIGVNTASLIQMQENCTLTSGPFGLGFAALALPAVVLTESGSSIEHIHAAVYALNFDLGSTGGTVQNAHGSRVVFIPNGVTTVNNSRGYVYDAPFGAISANAWGMYINADVENWFKQSVKIGDGDTVENDSVGLQVDDRAVLLPRLTTTERNALTGLNGMLIYNTTDNKFQGYENGSWVDL